MVNKKLENISAILDDEANQSELDSTLAELSVNQADKQAFSRYSLIGDALRNEQSLQLNDDFSAKISQTIANLDQANSEILQEQPADSNVVQLEQHPTWQMRLKNQFQKARNSRFTQVSGQLAIAASVAMVAVVGVNNLSQTEDNPYAPVISTVPLVDGIAPVSYSSAPLQPKLSADQATQARIHSLMADHHQQISALDDLESEQATLEFDTNNTGINE